MRIILVMVILLVTSTASFALNLPITVKEALPDGVSGKARVSEIASFGVPIGMSENITNINQLTLAGATSAQFRPLAWWPNGNIRWVLIDTLATVSAGGSAVLTLSDSGAGSFGGSDLAVDGSTISVNTGAATFIVKKSNFNLFDTVSVGATPLVMTGNSGGVRIIGADAVLYSSSNDSSSTAVIEENGPVKAVIKSTGALKNISGTRLFDYTARLYFYKNSSRVKAAVTIRNASNGSYSDKTFKTWTNTVSANIGAAKTVTFSRSLDTVSAQIPTGQSAYLWQGPNNNKIVSTEYRGGNPLPATKADCAHWTPPVPGTCSGGDYTFNTDYIGLEAVVGTTNLNTIGSIADYSAGWADVSDSSGAGITTAFQYLSGYWGGFTFTDAGEISTDVFASKVDQTLTFPAGKHYTQIMSWDFHSASNDGSVSSYALDYPLLGRTDFDYYKSSKALYGQSELVTASEQSSVYAAVGQSALAPSLANPSVTSVKRSWYWPAPGGMNQYDLCLSDFMDYLRTGYGGFYIRGSQWTDRVADGAVKRSDNFALEQISGATGPETGVTGFNMNTFDMEHAHASSIPFYYFLTGNEAIREAEIDYGEHMQRTQISGWNKVPTAGYFRAWSRKLRNLAYAYEFTCQVGACNDTYKTELTNAMNTFLDYREDGTLSKVGQIIVWETPFRVRSQYWIH